MIKVLYSFQGILIAHVFFNVPVVLQIVGSSWDKISQKYSNAARMLGCSSFVSFWKIDLPLLLPAISSAFILIFILCINSFVIVWVLGGNKNQIIETLVYELATIHLDYQAILPLIWFQIILGILITGIFYRCQVHLVAQEPTSNKSIFTYWKQNKILGTLAIGWLLLVLISVLGPLFSLVLDSFKDNSGLTIKWWSYFFKQGWRTIIPIFWRSFQIALGSAGLSFLLLLLVIPFFYSFPKKRKMLEIIFLLPLCISSIVLGLGWFLFYQDYLIQFSFPLILYLIFIHAIIFFPYWLRLFLPSLELLPKSWFQVKKIHNCHWLKFGVLVLIPWFKEPFLKIFCLIMALSFGELNILLMISDYETKTITTEIFSAISAYRFSYASLIGVLFILFFSLLAYFIKIITTNHNLQKQ